MIFWNDSFDYKCTKPPEWLRLLSALRELPSGWVPRCGPRIDWNNWLDYLRESQGKLSYEQMADEIGCSIQTVAENVRRLRHEGKLPEYKHIRTKGKMTPEMLETALQHIRAGNSIKSAARKIEVDFTSLVHHIRKNEITLPPHPPVNKKWKPEMMQVVEKYKPYPKGWWQICARELGISHQTLWKWVNRIWLEGEEKKVVA